MFQTDDPAALEMEGIDDPVLYDPSGKSLYDRAKRRCSYVWAAHSGGGAAAVSVRHTMITREIWYVSRIHSPEISGSTSGSATKHTAHAPRGNHRPHFRDLGRC